MRPRAAEVNTCHRSQVGLTQPQSHAPVAAARPRDPGDIVTYEAVLYMMYLLNMDNAETARA